MRHVAVLALGLALGGCGWPVSPVGGTVDAAFDAAFDAAGTASVTSALVPMAAHELAFYYPGPCNRCHLAAADDAAAMACCSTPEAGWDPLKKKVRVLSSELIRALAPREPRVAAYIVQFRVA